jgi:hypothetical protein
MSHFDIQNVNKINKLKQLRISLAETYVWCHITLYLLSNVCDDLKHMVLSTILMFAFFLLPVYFAASNLKKIKIVLQSLYESQSQNITTEEYYQVARKTLSLLILPLIIIL